MKRTLLLVATVALAFSASAQQVWTMQQCIDYALEHNIGIQQSQLSRQNADYQYEMTKDSWLPSINASAGEYLGFGQSPSYTGVYVPDNSSSTSVGLDVSLPLFQGLSIYNSTKSSYLNLQACTQDLEAAKRDLRLTIMAYYMQVVYCKELKGVAEQQLELSQNQYEMTRQLYEVGRKAEADVYESKAQVAANQSSLTEADNNLMLSLLDLTQAMEIESIENFDVVSPDEFLDLIDYQLPSPETTIENALNQQPIMQAAQLRLQQSLYDLKVAKSAWYPSLSFFGGYSNGYYNYFTKGYDNIPLPDQIKMNSRAQLGFSLNIPIFNRMQTRYRVKMAEVNIENKTLEIENKSKALKKEIQQAYYNALAAEQKYNSADNALKSSQMAFDYAEAGFEAGKTTQMELNESRTRLYQAESALLQAKYEYLYRCKVMEFYNEQE
ncbi:MAG: TolC family protein [Bacteroidales bacterium]|nr:TolC family protein [Bacteroidales bacterium]